ncbi:uncharacterized protein METZ01_LOCUS418526, partial [marine metagenome]
MFEKQAFQLCALPHASGLYQILVPASPQITGNCTGDSIQGLETGDSQA